MPASSKSRADGRQLYATALTIMSASGLLKFPYLCKPDADRPDTWIIAGQLVLTRGESDTISLTDPTTGATYGNSPKLRGIHELAFLAPPRKEHLVWILDQISAASPATTTDLGMAVSKLADSMGSTIPYRRNTAEHFIHSARMEKWVALASRGSSTLRGALWKIADPEKLRLTFRLFGHTATVAQYNFVAANWDQTHPGEPRQITLADLARTHFAALKVSAMRTCGQHRVQIYGPGFIGGTSRKSSAEASLRDMVERMPAVLREARFSPRVWRSITRAKPRGSTLLMRTALRDIALSEGPESLNTLALLSPETLPACTLSPLLKIVAYSNESIGRAVADEIRRRARKRTVRSFIPELDGLSDMLSSAKYDRRILPANITWTGLKALSDSWHEWSITSRQSTSFYSWAPLIGDRALGDAKVTELTDSDMLAAEGRAMHHCVGGYDWACAKGEVRIFHIAPNDGQPSTLELRFDAADKRWKIGQHYSYCNRPAGKANAAIAVRILRQANRSALFDGCNPPLAEKVKRAPSATAEPNPLDRYPQIPSERSDRARRHQDYTAQAAPRAHDVYDAEDLEEVPF